MNNIWIFDCEVVIHDWLFVFKQYLEDGNGDYIVIHNDSAALNQFILDYQPMLCGFNNKHYDSYILKAALYGRSPEEIKALNDFIILQECNGFDWPLMKGAQVPWFDQMDVKDDMQDGLSLKAIEGHLGMDIRESTVSFDIDRELTDAELEEMIFYCKHDVDATEAILRLRKGYFDAKRELGRMAGLSEQKSVYMTNAKLTAAYLNAVPHEFGDERQYSLPPRLNLQYIPSEVLEFFDRQHDLTISDRELFKRKTVISVGGCPTTIGFGGIHAALPSYTEEAQGTRIIRNYDVASLYPSLMLECGYTSRCMADPEWYKKVYTTRIAAKKSGDKKTANTLKLVLNTTYGAMLDKFNNLYDPRMGRNVCVGGQMYILELAQHYVDSIPSLRLIQLNTDGLMVSLEQDDLPKLLAINDEWQQRTHLNLEEDQIERIVQKDVNNYVEIQVGGAVKCKGGYLTMGIAAAGAFNVNNTMNVVKKALMAFLVDGTPVEEFIANDNDVTDYQIIAKAGGNYSHCFQLVDGEEVGVQKVNRVFACNNIHMGRIFKVHRDTGGVAKIENLPDHCMICNFEMPGISEIDKQFYINMTRKRIADFRGDKKGRKDMASTKNVYQKLLEARVKFMGSGVKKSGINRNVGFKYFELEDIVPVATRIFGEVGLIPAVNFSPEQAIMTIINVDAPDQCISFRCEMKEALQNKAVTPIQSYGAAITYTRRYLYQLALDISENDELDGTMEADKPVEAPAAVPVKKSIPATPAQREEVKQELTNPDGPASELQIKQLKAALKKLRDANPDAKKMIAEIGVVTKNLTEISKKQCEELMIQVGEELAKVESK